MAEAALMNPESPLMCWARGGWQVGSSGLVEDGMARGTWLGVVREDPEMQAGVILSSWPFALRVVGTPLKGQDPSGCHGLGDQCVGSRKEKGPPEVWPQYPLPLTGGGCSGALQVRE